MIRPGLARVVGASMEPTLRQGDLLVVLWGASPRVGSISVVRLPPGPEGLPRPLAVKRITGTDPADPGRWWVEGDNPGVGIDSWVIGSLAPESVLGRVLLHIPCRRPGFT